MPQIVGAGLTAPIAIPLEDADQRERQDARRSRSELPELDHNELAAGPVRPQLGRFSAVFLDDSDLHPRVRSGSS